MRVNEGGKGKGREKRGIRIKDVDTDPIISTGDVFMCGGVKEIDKRWIGKRRRKI
ncbi:hypothetical protein [Methanomicrobium mobile]|uniref:hypothetical protein n=1 Tax=Methanomicrobium mobile TaxID=2205 RepID=UPI0012F66225|nr:hypothetical protein [Methanomicrobium mobile]